ncbi:deaminase [Pedobacter yulinensis]|uniref:Deaminase n=1 Tax=Pedobacter yulinensis TaxID=2126353 RepID=A0A2T3HP43_9SPHI|nr:dihydrofolate reductase family protein [Pedobacter yulinensis]PST84151.1 deaminase [Pedobacter yulinensis]
MRKLKLQVQMTIDGFIGGPDGEMDWMTLPWSKDITEYVDDITQPIACIVLGRKLAEGFIPYWTSVAADPHHPEMYAGKKFTETPKIVFTKTLQESPWAYTTVSAGDVATEIGQLKSREGGDIMAYGGRQFVASLLRAQLVDELNLFVNPTAIGRGQAIFAELEGYAAFSLQQVIRFDCGIVLLQYVKRN